jgi:ribosomal protein L11 methyltransferase
LIVLAPLLEARIAPGGRIALSGLLDSQAPEVLQAYSGSCDMELASLQDHWALLEGRRR